MPRLLVIFLLLLVSVKTVSASVGEDVQLFNQKSLPPVGSQLGVDDLNNPITPDPTEGAPASGLLNEVKQYAHAETTESECLGVECFFKDLLARIRQLLGIGIKEEGNRYAQNFLCARLPQGVCNEMLARASGSKNLAQGNNTNVLGIGANGVSENAMDFAYDCSRCASLPFGACLCANTADYSGDLDPTPTGNLPVIPENMPAVCYEEPVCDRIDLSVGKCNICSKGFCAVDCLKPYFGNDEHLALRASQICNMESGGDPYAINMGCLRDSGKTLEYSIGLFQMSMWHEDFDPYTGEPRTYQCHGALSNQQVSPIYCEKGPDFDKCTTEFQNPAKNASGAYKLFLDRDLWIKDSYNHLVWQAWSVALPKYCDIKY